jgi:hypothetical protein
MTKKCSDCKFAFPYEHNQKWDDTFQKMYEEEVANNKVRIEDNRSWVYKMPLRFFWHDIKNAYDTEEEKKATYITCKCMPTYAERKKDDFCGQFQTKYYHDSSSTVDQSNTHLYTLAI